MAIRPLFGKDGKLSSFEITVSDGVDSSGKQKRHYETLPVEPGMTFAKAEKAAKKYEAELKQRIKRGEKVDNKITFAEYANTFVERRARTLKHKTVLNYRHLLERTNALIGHIKLQNLRPEHIAEFLDALRERGLRKGESRAVATRLVATLKEKKLSRRKLAAKAAISVATVDAAAHGQRVALDSAEKMAAALEMPVSKLFAVTNNPEPLSEKMVLKYYALVHLILKDAYKNGYVEYNAAERVDRPKPVNKEIGSLQPDEVIAIFEALEHVPIKWRAITHLMLITGCRRGEIAGLRWSKIDFDKQTIKIDKTILYSKERQLYEDDTKTRQTRFINIPDETVALLREYKSWYEQEKAGYGLLWQKATTEKRQDYERRFCGSDYLFFQEGGWPIHPDSINAWLKNFAKEYNLPPIHPHKFRHTQASVLIFAGADVVSVSKRLGHAQVSTTTNIYAHQIMEADAQNRDCLADIFFHQRKQPDTSELHG